MLVVTLRTRGLLSRTNVCELNANALILTQRCEFWACHRFWHRVRSLRWFRWLNELKVPEFSPPEFSNFLCKWKLISIRQWFSSGFSIFRLKTSNYHSLAYDETPLTSNASIRFVSCITSISKCCLICAVSNTAIELQDSLDSSVPMVSVSTLFGYVKRSEAVRYWDLKYKLYSMSCKRNWIIAVQRGREKKREKEREWERENYGGSQEKKKTK